MARSLLLFVVVAVVLLSAAHGWVYKPAYSWDTDSQVFRFTRAFPGLKAFKVDPDKLVRLGRAGGPMDEGDFGGVEVLISRNATVRAQLAEALIPGDAPEREAGYTFFGQFLDHDMTLEFTSDVNRNDNKPEELVNGETPYLDLSCVYGTRWDFPPNMLMDPIDSIKFLVGRGASLTRASDRGNPFDLPRNLSNEQAVLFDGRQDEQLIIAQFQGMFYLFHNRAVDTIRSLQPDWSDERVFEEARKLTRFHYQYVVRHEHLTAIVNPKLVENIAKTGNRIYKCSKTVPLALPVEFTVAAYRWGHSAVRPKYRFNDFFFPVSFLPLDIELNDTSTTLRGGRNSIVPWIIGWNRFFDHPLKGTNDTNGRLISTAQKGRRIDRFIAHGLLEFLIPGTDFSLASRNLKRGWALGLPSGQAVARHMRSYGCGNKVYTNDDFGLPKDEWDEKETPLWLYCLEEARLMTDGDKLDGVCGRLVAEVFLGLLKCDPMSYYNLCPSWSPKNSVLTLNGQPIETILDIAAFAGLFGEFGGPEAQVVNAMIDAIEQAQAGGATASSIKSMR